MTRVASDAAPNAPVPSAPAGGAGASRVLPGGTVRLTVGYPGDDYVPRKRTYSDGELLRCVLPLVLAYVSVTIAAAGGQGGAALTMLVALVASMCWLLYFCTSRRNGFDAGLSGHVLRRGAAFFMAISCAALLVGGGGSLASRVRDPGTMFVAAVGGVLFWFLLDLWRSESRGRASLVEPPTAAPTGLRLRLGLGVHGHAREILRVLAERREYTVPLPDNAPPLFVAVGDTPPGLVLEPGGAIEVRIEMTTVHRRRSLRWLAPPPESEGWTLVVESLVAGRPHLDVVRFEPPPPSSSAP